MIQNSRKALLLALAGFVMLSIGDVVVKTMAGAWPATGIAALRWAIGAVGLTAIIWLQQGRAGFAMPKPHLQLARGAVVAIASLSFFASLHVIPLADAVAIVFLSPVLVAVYSAIVMGERITPTAWAAIALAFVGVLVVLRPNLAELGVPALLPLLAAFGMAALFLLNRRAAGLAPPLLMQLLIAPAAVPLLIGAAAAGHVSGAMPIPVPDLAIVLKVLIVAVCATAGHLLIYQATERASAATIAPMTYVQILVAVAAGWLLFGEPPNATILAGTGMIVVAGLLLWSAVKQPAVAETPN